MKTENTPKNIIENIEKFKNKVDILIGISSFNNSETISNVAKKAASGIVEYFGSKGMIVNSDGGSVDGTSEKFMKTDTFGIPKLSFRYVGIPGKGSAMRSIMEIASFIKSKVVIFLDADLKSIEPWWIERFAMPILEGKAEYVTPYYTRHKYDGTITNQVCFPMTSILYGKKVRQPIGGDFGVSLKLIDLFLNEAEKTWKEEVAKFGIDIWMTTNSIVHNGKVMQSALGAKVHDVKDPGKHLGPMFKQVVGTLFNLMVEFDNVWSEINEMNEVEIYGKIPKVDVEEVIVDIENLQKKASNEVAKEREKLQYLPNRMIDEVSKNGELDLKSWVNVLYDSSVEFKRRNKDMSIVENLIPFYFARVANFVMKTKDMSNEKAENVIIDQLEYFMEMKEYLKTKWFD